MTTKWKCPNCGSINDTFYKKCNCGQGVTEEEQKKYEISDVDATSLLSSDASTNQLQTNTGNRSILSRYKDAYFSARAITTVGTTVKVAAFIISGCIVLLGFVAGSHSMQFIFGGIIIGVIFGIPIYILGIIVSAQGQILKATLDTAVNTSPQLTKDEMRKMMSLD